MELNPDSPLAHLIWPTAGAMIATIFIRRRLLHPGSLDHAPNRETGLETADLLPLAALWIFGQLAAQYFLSLATLPDDAAVHLTARLFAQIAMQVPMLLFVGYVMARRAAGPGDDAPPSKRLSHRVDHLGFRIVPRQLPGLLVRALIGLAAGLPIVFGVNEVSLFVGSLLGASTPDVGHKLLEEIGQSHDPATLAVFGLSVVFVAPLMEELVYRGFLQTCFRASLTPWTTILLAASLFSLMHLAVVPVQVIPGLFCLGVILGWLYERTGSLWPGILVHAGFNLANILLYFALALTKPDSPAPA